MDRVFISEILSSGFAFYALSFGLSWQIWRNYQEGESRLHWMVNGPLVLASLFRIDVMYASERYVLMAVDVIAMTLNAIVVLQWFGYFLRKKTT